MVLLDPPPRSQAAGVSAATLRLTVAGEAWSLPMDAVRGIAEMGSVTALPLAEPPVEGVAAIEGCPLTVVDTARALGRTAGAGRVLVVVATAVGELALRVDEARMAGRPDAPELDIAGLLPWAGAAVAVAAGGRPPRRAATALPLLHARHGATEVALRIDRLDRIGRPVRIDAMPGSPDSLIHLDEELYAARFLSPDGTGTAPHALILRGDAGDRAALLVDNALSVERCPLDRLAAVRHSDGSRSLWWRRAEGASLRVVDPGPLFGWAACADDRLQPGGPLPGAPLFSHAARGGRPEVLVLEIAGHAVALPLALVGEVEDGGAAGGGVRVRLAGMRRRLHADRARLLDVGASDWRSLKALPPAAALLFDAARWDGPAARWVFRANIDTLTQPGGKRVAWAPKRALAAAWRGWAAGHAASAEAPCPERLARSAFPATGSNLSVTASP
ncbi:chemotaxis protein CheW [Azospirillum sp. TSO35-2]|uniref:chemotaxis protein CheW n=1 Tax=Azospirillum sp. TSO35-2 TaxID=716796 RepID=UPI0011B3CAFB|nr:chemotaxis protein CheW [Azospirillum sp. TSO35-2]